MQGWQERVWPLAPTPSSHKPTWGRRISTEAAKSSHESWLGRISVSHGWHCWFFLSASFSTKARKGDFQNSNKAKNTFQLFHDFSLRQKNLLWIELQYIQTPRTTWRYFEMWKNHKFLLQQNKLFKQTFYTKRNIDQNRRVPNFFCMG